MRARGWDEFDILIVTGDAYVDHPAFGPVLIARFLEARGYKVGLIAQPSWKSLSTGWSPSSAISTAIPSTAPIWRQVALIAEPVA